MSAPLFRYYNSAEIFIEVRGPLAAARTERRSVECLCSINTPCRILCRILL